MNYIAIDDSLPFIAVDDSLPFIDLVHSDESLRLSHRYYDAFSQLTDLELCARSDDNLPNLVALVPYAAETLEVLTLSFFGGILPDPAGSNPWAQTPPFRFESLERLHTLQIKCKRTTIWGNLFFNPLVNVLETIQTLPPNLKILSLRGRSDIDGSLTTINWRPLEELLSTPDFKKIPNVLLSLAYCNYAQPVRNNEERSEFHKELEALAVTAIPSAKTIQSIDCTCAFD